MIANIVPFRRPLSKHDAEMLVRELVGTTLMGWTDHAIDQMVQREISDRQVISVLEDGKITRGPDWSEEYSDWACVFYRPTCGRTVRVVVGIDANRKKASVVTVY